MQNELKIKKQRCFFKRKILIHMLYPGKCPSKLNVQAKYKNTHECLQILFIKKRINLQNPQYAEQYFVIP